MEFIDLHVVGVYRSHPSGTLRTREEHLWSSFSYDIRWRLIRNPPNARHSCWNGWVLVSCAPEVISASSSTYVLSETMTICHILLRVRNRRITDAAACSILALPGFGSEAQETTWPQSHHPPPRIDLRSRTSATPAPTFSVRVFKKTTEHRQVGNAHLRRTCQGP